MSWKKLEPISPKMHGCLNCGVLVDKASLDMRIAVGFGDAHVEKDGEIIYSETDYKDAPNKIWTVRDAEYEVLKDPDHDWRIILFAPLRG